MQQVFLSYARSDDDGLRPDSLVRRLHADLTSAGLDVWWDRVSMPSRALSFLDEIRREIEARDRVLLMVGPGALASAYVRDEWHHALRLCKPVVPALLVDDYRLLPRELRQIDARLFGDARRYAEQLATLIRQLGADAAPVGIPVAVPELPAELVARPDDLEAVRGFVLRHTREVGAAEVRWLALRGMPGVGKSVLGAAAGRDCEVRLAFPDGVFWVPIGQTPSLPTRQSALAAAVDDSRSHDFKDVDGGRAVLSRLFAGRSCLLILDDVWAADAVRAFDVLGSRGRLLFMTRDAEVALSLGSAEVRLDVMSAEQAAALLRNWAGRVEPEFAEIVQRLGGLPLALKLAGAALREGSSVAAWLETFRAVSDLRLGRRSTSAEDSVQVSIELSVSRLDRGDRALYHGLGIFQAGGEIPAAIAMRLWQALEPGRGDRYYRELAVDLGRLGLVDRRASDGAITMHALLHAYTREMLGNGRAATHAVLLDAYNPDRLPWAEIADDGYLRDHLANHLLGAGRRVELAGLFADQAWLTARFAQRDHTYRGFLNDLTVAWRDEAAPRVLEQIERGEEPAALADCVRYALIRSSVHSLASALRPSLVVRALRVGPSDAQQALTLARSVPDAAARAEMAVALLETELIEGSPRAMVTATALAAIELIPPDGAGGERDPRIALLGRAARFLDSGTAERALVAALGGRMRVSGWHARLALAPALPVERVRELLDADLTAALALADPQERAHRLQVLAPHLRDAARVRAIEAWIAALPSLPATEHTPGEGDFSPRGQALAALAAELGANPDDDCRSVGAEQALARVLDLVAGIDNDWGRLLAIQALAPGVPDRDVSRLVNLALTLDDQRFRAAALASLAPRLNGVAADRAATTSQATADRGDRLTVSVALASRPDPEWRDRALDAALALGDAGADACARVLAALAPGLDSAQLGRALGVALAAARARGSVAEIAALAPHLGRDERTAALAVAVDAVQALQSRRAMAHALAAVAPHLDAPALGRALALAMSQGGDEVRASALAALAPHVADESLARILDIACTMGDARARETLLSAVAPRLRGATQARALEFVLALPNGRERAVLVKQLAPVLEPPLLAVALDAALEFSTSSFSHLDYRSWALDALAPRLDRALLERAFARLSAIPDELDVARTLATLAPSVPDSRPALQPILDRVDAWEHPAVLPLLSPHERAVWVDRAGAIADLGRRATALTALARDAESPERDSIVARAFEAALTIDDPYAAAFPVAELIPLLAGNARERALRRAAVIADALGDEWRWIDEEQWDELQKWSRLLRLSDISALLDDARQARALDQACACATSPFGAGVLLERLAPTVGGSGVERMLAATVAMRSDGDRARVLAALAPRLDAGLLAQALAATLAFRDEGAKATTLAALAPRLAGEPLDRAHQAGLAIREPRDRIRALVGFIPTTVDAAALRVQLGRTLLACLDHDRPGERRQQLLWFLADRRVFVPPVLSPATLDAVVGHVVDVCTRWRWM